jgi:alpha-beta hydrolase superfamily lysophospholipase
VVPTAAQSVRHDDAVVEHEEGTLPASGLYWQTWPSRAPVTGLVVLVHGAHEHGGRYAHVAERFLAAGYQTYAVDHAGHGRSPGKRGNIGSMAATVAGVDELARFAQTRHPEVPTFVYGHSLGGLIALQYVTGTPVALHGVIVSAPAVDVSAATPLQIRASSVLSRLVPNLGVLQLDAETVSRDPAVVHAYRTDPLNFMGKMRARTGAEILATVSALGPRLAGLKLPLYVLHGTADRLVPPAATDWVEQHATMADLTVRRLDGLYHEPHNEPEQAAVLDDIVTWMDAHRPLSQS